MGSFRDLTGQRFGRLVVMERVSRNASRGNVRFVCRCDCGTTTTRPADYLTSGDSKSCGCTQNSPKHGLARHPLYFIWITMIRRCYNENDKQWHSYGGRGIVVCPQWQGIDGLAQFINDMGERPKKCSIERKNNDGPYSPENCRWATNEEQQRNTRRNFYIEHDGFRLCLADWERKTGISRTAIKGRIRAGLPIENVLDPTFNRSRKHYIEHGDTRLCLADWARRLGIGRQKLVSHLKKGLPIGDLVSSVGDAPTEHQ